MEGRSWATSTVVVQYENSVAMLFCTVQYPGSYRNTYRKERNIPDIYRNSNKQGGLFFTYHRDLKYQIIYRSKIFAYCIPKQLLDGDNTGFYVWRNCKKPHTNLCFSSVTKASCGILNTTFWVVFLSVFFCK
jgi:hypothetical protein